MSLFLALALTASLAQQPPAQAPPAKPAGPTAAPAPGAQTAAAPKPGPWEFGGDIGFFYVVVRNDKAAQFDTAMARLKQAFAAKEATPERKRQAAGWRVFKSSEAATPPPTAATPPVAEGGAAPAAPPAPSAGPTVPTITYIFMIDPVAKKMSYNVVDIMREIAPNDVQAFYDQLTDAIVSITRIGATELLRMGGGS